MSKEKKVQQILESWKGSGRLNADSWENVQQVLDFYGFIYQMKKHWVCQHPSFIKLAKSPDAAARAMFEAEAKFAGLSNDMEFSIAVRHGKDAKTDVQRPYLDILLKAVSLLEGEVVVFLLEKQQQKEVDKQ